MPDCANPSCGMGTHWDERAGEFYVTSNIGEIAMGVVGVVVDDPPGEYESLNFCSIECAATWMANRLGMVLIDPDATLHDNDEAPATVTGWLVAG